MVTLKVTVEDEQAEALKKLLTEMSFVKTIEQEQGINEVKEPETAYERLVKIQKAIGDKKLFVDIKDPSEWQREIRKEWDCDF